MTDAANPALAEMEDAVCEHGKAYMAQVGPLYENMPLLDEAPPPPPGRREPPIPTTIRRLADIRPGERVRFYSGRKSEIDHAPAEYRQMMHDIFAFAQGRAARGLIEIFERPRFIESGPHRGLIVMDYIAVGKAQAK
jgi:hypothetical protein